MPKGSVSGPAPIQGPTPFRGLAETSDLVQANIDKLKASFVAGEKFRALDSSPDCKTERFGFISGKDGLSPIDSPLDNIDDDQDKDGKGSQQEPVNKPGSKEVRQNKGRGGNGRGQNQSGKQGGNRGGQKRSGDGGRNQDRRGGDKNNGQGGNGGGQKDDPNKDKTPINQSSNGQGNGKKEDDPNKKNKTFIYQTMSEKDMAVIGVWLEDGIERADPGVAAMMVGACLWASDRAQRLNEERLQWADRHGFKITDATLRYGLLDFPGLGACHPSPEPEESRPPMRSPSPVPPDPVLIDLWKDLTHQLQNLKLMPSLWVCMPDAITRWLENPSLKATDVLETTAQLCFKEYLMTFIPLHMMHLLVGNSNGDTEYLRGSQGNGTIDADTVKNCLRAVLVPGILDAERDIVIIMALSSKFPKDCRRMLAANFETVSSRSIPFIFRYIFASNEEFKKEVAAELEKKYGLYEELDWKTLIRPLPRGWDEEGRTAKRQKTDDGELISFGSLDPIDGWR